MYCLKVLTRGNALSLRPSTPYTSLPGLPITLPSLPPILYTHHLSYLSPTSYYPLPIPHYLLPITYSLVPICYTYPIPYTSLTPYIPTIPYASFLRSVSFLSRLSTSSPTLVIGQVLPDYDTSFGRQLE